jgi:hypothetical protein
MGSLADVALHCIVCYEEFSVKDRPPVVLPCGHTYVCLVCSKRLKRCMECREPLFWTPPAHSQKPLPHMPIIPNSRSPAPHRYGAPLPNRGRYSPAPHTPPPPVVKEEPLPLPLPKNLVLIEMIESAERQARFLREAMGNLDEDGEPLEDEEEEDEESKLEKNLAGLSALTGTCGTYAVRESEGLAVLPFDPNKQHKKVLALGGEEEKKTEEPREPFTIDVGHTVQVVSVDEGIYKLARDAGYVVATANQLVKRKYCQTEGELWSRLMFANVLLLTSFFCIIVVGGALEKSCQLEGMMESVISKEQMLQKALAEIKRLKDGLRNKIEMEQQQTPEHPVICAPKVLEEDTFVSDENDLLAIGAHPTTPPKMSISDSSSPGALRLSQSTDSTAAEAGDRANTTQHFPSVHSPAHSCPMPTYVDPINRPFMEEASAGLPAYRVYTDDDDFHGLDLGFGCGSTLFGERLIDRDRSSDQLMSLSYDDSFVEDNNTVGGRSRSSSNTMPLPGPSHGSESPGRPESPVFRTASFDNGVNFRTGMSGHRGLNQTRKKGASSPSARREVRMMSVHSGIGVSRGTNNNNNNNRRAETQSNSFGTRVLTPPDRIQY